MVYCLVGYRLRSSACAPKDLILLATTGMGKHTSEASVFVPNSTSEANPIYSKLNEKSGLISIGTKIDKQSAWICTKSTIKGVDIFLA